METWLDTSEGERVEVKRLRDGAPCAETPDRPCACGSTLVQGKNMQVEGRDTFRSDGYCAKCQARRGVLRARVPTLFGLEEDQRVLAGPWKVY